MTHKDRTLKGAEKYSQRSSLRHKHKGDPLAELMVESGFEPYDVTCARCGKVLSCVDAFVEEGNEWECGPCWQRCNALERAK